METIGPPPDPSFSIEKVNTLAAPKGVLHRCELTGLPAQVMLVTPYLTLYYASREHAANAWDAIMHRVVHVVGALRTATPAIGREERQKQSAGADETRKRLIALCQSEASKACVRGEFHLAIPAAVYALVFLTEVYGDGSLELVGAHLLLAEANLGARRFPQAEQFLTLANWVLVKNPQASDALRSTLRRNFGKLYAAQGRREDALAHLADDVYFSSLMFGPEHVHTSGGYFEMGVCFFALGRVEPALAFYDKVVDIWYKAATRLLYAPDSESNADAGAGGEGRTGGAGADGAEAGAGGPDATSAPVVDEAMRSAGVEMLKEVRKRRAECVGDRNIATGEADYVLGLLRQLGDDHEEAERLFANALEVYRDQLGMEHHSTRDVTNSLQMLKEVRAERGMM